MKQIRNLFILMAMAGALWLARPAFAAAPAVTNRWDANVAAGLTLTRGNSETLLTTLAFKAGRKATNSEVLLGASGAYGETTRETKIGRVTKEETQRTASSASAYGQYNRLFTEHFFGGGRVDFLHDAIADLHYRVTVSPLVGVYLYKTPTTRLSLEAGPSGIFERQGKIANQYAALRLGEKFEHKFTPKARVWQSLDVIPQVDRFANYLVIGELGGEASFTDKVSLRAVLQDVYDNEPAIGRKDNDVKLVTSIVYKF